MKILQIINNLGSGGAEKLLEDLAPILNQYDDVACDILLLTDKGNVFHESLLKKGVSIDVVPFKNIYNPLNIFKIAKYIKTGNYDIVHSHLFPTQYWVALAQKLLKSKKTKFLTTEHSTNNRRRGKCYFKPVERYIYSSYDKIVCITDEVRSNLVRWLAPEEADLGKYVVINNGVNIEKIKNASPYKKNEILPGFTENTKLICMVGRFSKAKDQKTLIKAMSFLPENVHLLLIGEGPLRESCEEFSNGLNLTERIHFLGFRNDVANILKTSDVTVLSSHWEGLSIASIEAMAAEKPFVASKVPGLEDMVYGHGLLFEEGNSKELANIIAALLDDNDYYNDIAKKCSNRANDFGIDRMANLSLSAYNELLSI